MNRVVLVYLMLRHGSISSSISVVCVVDCFADPLDSAELHRKTCESSRTDLSDTDFIVLLGKMLMISELVTGVCLML